MGNVSTNIRVLVSDASTMACELLAERLRRTKLDVVACCVTPDEVLASIGSENTNADVVILSANLQDARLGGFKCLREIRKRDPQVRTIMLLDDRDRELVISAFRGGAKGVFFRADAFNALAKCVRAVHQGQVWASSRDLEATLEALATALPLREVNPNVARTLTKREEQIVTLVAQGLTNREMAHELFLSEHTVKNYLFRIFEKLNVSSRVELVLHTTTATAKDEAA